MSKISQIIQKKWALLRSKADVLRLCDYVETINNFNPSLENQDRIVSYQSAIDCLFDSPKNAVDETKNNEIDKTVLFPADDLQRTIKRNAFLIERISGKVWIIEEKISDDPAIALTQLSVKPFSLQGAFETIRQIFISDSIEISENITLELSAIDILVNISENIILEEEFIALVIEDISDLISVDSENIAEYPSIQVISEININDILVFESENFKYDWIISENENGINEEDLQIFVISQLALSEICNQSEYLSYELFAPSSYDVRDQEISRVNFPHGISTNTLGTYQVNIDGGFVAHIFKTLGENNFTVRIIKITEDGIITNFNVYKFDPPGLTTFPLVATDFSSSRKKSITILGLTKIAIVDYNTNDNSASFIEKTLLGSIIMAGSGMMGIKYIKAIDRFCISVDTWSPNYHCRLKLIAIDDENNVTEYPESANVFDGNAWYFETYENNVACEIGSTGVEVMAYSLSAYTPPIKKMVVKRANLQAGGSISLSADYQIAPDYIGIPVTICGDISGDKFVFFYRENPTNYLKYVVGRLINTIEIEFGNHGYVVHNSTNVISTGIDVGASSWRTGANWINVIVSYNNFSQDQIISMAFEVNNDLTLTLKDSFVINSGGQQSSCSYYDSILDKHVFSVISDGTGDGLYPVVNNAVYTMCAGYYGGVAIYPISISEDIETDENFSHLEVNDANIDEFSNFAETIDFAFEGGIWEPATSDGNEQNENDAEFVVINPVDIDEEETNSENLDFSVINLLSNSENEKQTEGNASIDVLNVVSALENERTFESSPSITVVNPVQISESKKNTDSIAKAVLSLQETTISQFDPATSFSVSTSGRNLLYIGNGFFVIVGRRNGDTSSLCAKYATLTEDDVLTCTATVTTWNPPTIGTLATAMSTSHGFPDPPYATTTYKFVANIITKLAVITFDTNSLGWTFTEKSINASWILYDKCNAAFFAFCSSKKLVILVRNTNYEIYARSISFDWITGNITEHYNSPMLFLTAASNGIANTYWVYDPEYYQNDVSYNDYIIYVVRLYDYYNGGIRGMFFQHVKVSSDGSMTASGLIQCSTELDNTPLAIKFIENTNTFVCIFIEETQSYLKAVAGRIENNGTITFGSSIFILDGDNDQIRGWQYAVMNKGNGGDLLCNITAYDVDADMKFAFAIVNANLSTLVVTQKHYEIITNATVTGKASSAKAVAPFYGTNTGKREKYLTIFHGDGGVGGLTPVANRLYDRIIKYEP